MALPLDAALQRHTIARRQHIAALKELAGIERANLRAVAPMGTATQAERVAATRHALRAAESDVSEAPARTVWAFLIKVEALACETMSPEAAEALRRDACALLDAQTHSFVA